MFTRYVHVQFGCFIFALLSDATVLFAYLRLATVCCNECCRYMLMICLLGRLRLGGMVGRTYEAASKLHSPSPFIITQRWYTRLQTVTHPSTNRA